MAKAKFSIKENDEEAFEMESEEGDQVHLGGEGSLEVSTVADGNAMVHIEGLVVKDDSGDSEAESLDLHLSQGDKITLASPDGESSWEVTLISTAE